MNCNLIIITSILFLTILQIEAEYVKFYDPSIDHIEVIGAGNFSQTILDSNRFTILECYANWCGFSKRFIPKWYFL